MEELTSPEHIIIQGEQMKMPTYNTKIKHQFQYYTRHPHYPEVILKTSAPKPLTASTFSQSNRSATGDQQFAAALSICDSSSQVDDTEIPFPHQTQGLTTANFQIHVLQPDNDQSGVFGCDRTCTQGEDFMEQMLFKMDLPCSSKQIQQSQLKIATLRKFDKVMRLRGLNRTPVSSSQKSSYSLFEDLADINVLDEASDEEDINSSCGQSRADDCGEGGCLITIDEFMIMGGRYCAPLEYDASEVDEDTPMEHDVLGDHSDVMLDDRDDDLGVEDYQMSVQYVDLECKFNPPFNFQSENTQFSLGFNQKFEKSQSQLSTDFMYSNDQTEFNVGSKFAVNLNLQSNQAFNQTLNRHLYRPEIHPKTLSVAENNQEIQQNYQESIQRQFSGLQSSQLTTDPNQNDKNKIAPQCELRHTRARNQYQESDVKQPSKNRRKKMKLPDIRLPPQESMEQNQNKEKPPDLNFFDSLGKQKKVRQIHFEDQGNLQVIKKIISPTHFKPPIATSSRISTEFADPLCKVIKQQQSLNIKSDFSQRTEKVIAFWRKKQKMKDYMPKKLHKKKQKVANQKLRVKGKFVTVEQAIQMIGKRNTNKLMSKQIKKKK